MQIFKSGVMRMETMIDIQLITLVSITWFLVDFLF